MSSNNTKKEMFPEFKFPLSRSHNNSLIEEVSSNTPQKDLFLNLKPQANMSNLLLNINASNISTNKYSFDPRLFINEYNSGNKNSNSGFVQEKMNNNSLIYFNSTKKEKKLIGKKRKLFKYILSSEKKITKKNIEIKNMSLNNIDINITQICLHRYHLLNLYLIGNNNIKSNIKNISFSDKTIKFIKKKFPFFSLIAGITDKINEEKMKKDINLDKINLTLNELRENNLDYFPNENNCEKLLKNYCDEMQNILNKIKTDCLAKKKIIYISRNILLLELLIRNWNLFTTYLINKYSKENKIGNNNNNQDNFSLGKFILFSTKQTIPLATKKFFAENLPENHTTTTKKENLLVLNDNNNNISSITKQKTTLFKAKIPSSNEYKCDFCERVFKNGQALGGHISQSHPKQSNKYKQKIEIRNKRTKRRELLYKARRQLFNAYNIDLDYLLQNKRKNEIKNFIKIHKAEYKKELIALKNDNNSNHILSNVIKTEIINENNDNNSDISNNIDIDINTSFKEKDK